MKKIFVIGLVVISVVMTGFFYLQRTAKSQAQQRPDVQKFDKAKGASQGREVPLGCDTCGAEDKRRIYAPTIALSETRPGKIVLNCRSDDPIEGTAIFYTQEGKKIIGQTFTMQPNEMRFVTIDSLLPEEQKNRTDWGGMDIQYFGAKMELWAQITLLDQEQRGSSDVTFSVINGIGSDTQEAVWYQPKGKSVLALGNSSENQIQTRVEYSDGQVKEVIIPAFGTRYLRRNYVSQGGQSVKITTVGEAGALKAVGYVSSESAVLDKRFAGSIRFYDTKGTVQSKLFANNFRVGNESHLVIKNTSEDKINISPTFKPTEGNGEPLVIPSLTLTPGEIREIDLIALRESHREDLKSVFVEIGNDGVAGSLIGSLNSRKGDNLYEIPLRDSGRMRNSTGAYPWRIDDDYTTVVTLTNTSSNSVRIGARLLHEGGQYNLGFKNLLPGETARFDINKIHAEQIPDEKGQTIQATKGQFKWSILGPGENDRVVGRAEVVSTSRNESMSYSCGQNCPESGPGYGTETVISFGLGTNHQTRGVQYWYSFPNGYPYAMYSTLPGLSDSDPSIAVSTQPYFFETAGYDSGLTSWYTDAYTYYYWFDGGFDCFLDSWSTYSSEPVEVIPNVQITVPSNANDGSTVTFSSTISGTETPESYTWSYTPTSGGNNPNLSLTSSMSGNTNATAKWWASPNDACTASTNSNYTVKLRTTWADHNPIEKTKTFTVMVPWTDAGVTTGNWAASGSTIRARNRGGQWYNSALGTYSISTGSTVVINVPASSQFYTKTVDHENVHVSQWNSNGLFGQQFTNAGLWAAIQNLTASTELQLISATYTATTNYANARNAAAYQLCNQGEIDAYAVSDLVAPQYIYQRCNRTQFSNCQ